MRLNSAAAMAPFSTCVALRDHPFARVRWERADVAKSRISAPVQHCSVLPH